jgi:hypothetical protein
MKRNLQSLDGDLDIEVVEAPQVKGRNGRISESFVMRSLEADEEELSPAAMSEAEGDEFGPLAVGLEELLEWIDVVDPETAQVTRRPILKETALESADDQPAGIVEAPDEENTEGSIGQENSGEDLIATVNPAAEAPPPLADKTAITDTRSAEVNDAMEEIVGYLLSSEGAQLRRQVRGAAYTARKTAYEAAQREIQPLIEEAQNRLAEAAAPKDNKRNGLHERALSAARNAYQAANRQAEESQRQFQVAQAAYEQAASRVHQMITLVEMGKAPAMLAQGLEATRLELTSEMLASWARCDRAQVELERETQGLQEIETSLRSRGQEQEAQILEQKADIEDELNILHRRLKERQQEIVAGVPEVVLWKAVQEERRRREDEQAAKLIEQLASQGIRKTLQEAARLGISQNASLQSAVTERQKRVNFLIDFCREKAETLSAFPEVLPDGAQALLVRGDSIRVVDAAGRELAALFSNREGTELHTKLSKHGRRWKLNKDRDIYLVKK